MSPGCAVSSHCYLDMSPQEILFGDVGNLEKMFVLPMDNSSEMKTEQMLIDMTKRNELPYEDMSDDIIQIVNGEDPSFDIMEFNRITKSLNVSTRRQDYGYKLGETDPEGDIKITEETKKQMLINDGLQILMHSRYKIAGALRHRMLYQRDKRYRMGYLFNRLRRLMTEQRKVITLARSQYADRKLEHLESTMSLYERVVRLDVDMRDTAAFIQREFARPGKADFFF